MGQASRTTKLLLDLSPREGGGANSEKRGYLQATVAILNRARAFYLDFFLAHPAKLTERVPVTSKTTGEEREATISTDQLLTWAEFQTVATQEHPHPMTGWNFSQQFPDFPSRYRRSVIKDSLGKARGYLTAIATQAGQVERSRGSRACLHHAITRPCMTARTALNSMHLTCALPSCVSKSSRENSGVGSTTQHTTTAFLRSGEQSQDGRWKALSSL